VEPLSGTITFLFTDIENSARLWEDHPEAMRIAHARHLEIVASCVKRHAGELVRAQGENDNTFSVFSSASQAVAAAICFQRALAAESWLDSTPIRVRAGMHAGTAYFTGGEYNSADVNRAARLRSLARGGQTLASEAVFTLARTELPEDISLRDLGRYRLKGLTESEQVYQVCHLDLRPEFSALASLDGQHTNLPKFSTSFVGRENDIGQIGRLLAEGRLITLTGAGGCGKTRLALHLGTDLLDQFSDGVWLAELAPLTDSTLVPQTIATALGLREEYGRSLASTLGDYLKERSLLLILDNCEHVTEACAHVTEFLLRTCPQLKVLATSREPLGISGEFIWNVPSLTFPVDETIAIDGVINAEALSEYTACQLFMERAGMLAGTLAAGPSEATKIAQICARLDGIPLAIELAAARTTSLHLDEIYAGLDDRFQLRTEERCEFEPRQRTLRSLIDWSYELLQERERTLMHRLSAFAGGWTLQACESVCADDGIDVIEVLDLLTSLVDKSLVQFEEPDGVPRYRMLETIRQYSRELLEASGEDQHVLGSHYDYYLELARDAVPHLVGGAQKETLDLFERERANLQAALNWALKDCADAGPALVLANLLWRFWNMRGYFTEGRRQLKSVLKVDGGTPLQRAYALHAAGSLAWRQGDYEDAESLYADSLALYKDLDDSAGIALALNSTGLILVDRGEYEAASSAYNESLRLRRACGDPYDIANSLNNMGTLASRRSDYDRARELYNESLTLFRSLGDRHGMALVLGNLGIVERSLGRNEAAWEAQQESLALRRELGDRAGIALALGNLGLVAFQRCDYRAAAELQNESLSLRRRLGDTGGVLIALSNLAVVAREQGLMDEAKSRLCECLSLAQRLGNRSATVLTLINLGLVAHREERPELAVTLWAAAGTQQKEIGSPLPPGEQAQLNDCVAALRDELGTEAFDAIWAEGFGMGLEEAVRHALEHCAVPSVGC
jgi:predicted ATPase/class 3 adenylate cyclase